MTKYVEIINQKFGNLTVISLHHIKTYNCGQKVEFYLCKCDCNKETIVSKHNLLSGHTKSCGCLKHIAYNYTHKLTNTRIYKIWCDIKVRCYNKNSKNYINYGKRGIKMCEDWKNDFTHFFSWAIKNGYNDKLSIDRINVNGNYSPDNCRWTTIKEQARNTRRNHYITYKNETKCIAEWAEIYNLNYKNLCKKINRGKTLEQVINEKREK